MEEEVLEKYKVDTKKGAYKGRGAARSKGEVVSSPEVVSGLLDETKNVLGYKERGEPLQWWIETTEQRR